MSDAPGCHSFESVLDALLGDPSPAEAESARAHLAACPACARLARMNDLLRKTPLGGASPVRGACPPVEVLAAYVAGGPDVAGGESIESHLAACAACRGAAGEGTGEPAPVSARLLVRARALFREHVRPASAGSGVSPQRLSAPVAWMLVPLAAAAGLLGGVVAVRWFSPAPLPAPEPPAVVRSSSIPSAEALRRLDRRQADLEARAAGLERRMAERQGDGETASAEAKALAGAVEALRKDLAAVDATVRAMTPSAPAAPVAAPEPVADLRARLDRMQGEVSRLHADLASVREANARTEQALAAARQEQARHAGQVRSLEEKLAAAIVPVEPPPDYGALLTAVRQGSREDFRKAIAALQDEGLDVLGNALAYYTREAPKEHRAVAGEALTRRGAKGVDHDLILALTHGQEVVRREASVLLMKNRMRGLDVGFQAAAPAEDRQRALYKAVRWWESEYRDDFPEKDLIRQGALILIPGRPVPIGPTPGTAVPGTGAGTPTPPPPPPPQYDPPR